MKLVESNVDVLKPFAHPGSQHRLTSVNTIQKNRTDVEVIVEAVCPGLSTTLKSEVLLRLLSLKTITINEKT